MFINRRNKTRGVVHILYRVAAYRPLDSRLGVLPIFKVFQFEVFPRTLVTLTQRTISTAMISRQLTCRKLSWDKLATIKTIFYYPLLHGSS